MWGQLHCENESSKQKENQKHCLFVPSPLNSYVEVLIPKVTDSIRRWDLWEVSRFGCGQEGGAPKKELVPLQEEEERPALTVSAPVCTHAKQSSFEGRSGGGCLQAPRQALPQNECASALILDFLASRAVRDRCPPFRPPSLWHSVIAPMYKDVHGDRKSSQQLNL